MKNAQFIILMTVLMLTFNSYGQKNTKNNKIEKETQSNKLVSTWKLIDYLDFDSTTGKWIHPYGEHPRGYFTYTESGIVNLNVSAEIPLAITEDSAKKYNINLYKLLDNYSFGYFGTYTIDFKNSTVTHHPKGGALPWYIGTDQHRQFILKGDTLFIGDPTFSVGKRVLVRER